MEHLLGIVNSLEMNELHRAVQENRLEAVQFLVKNGADIANTIEGGRTPLHIAVRFNHDHIIKELFAGKSRSELRLLINTRIRDCNTTALDLAARNNSLWSTRFLLSYGAQIDVEDKSYRQAESLTVGESITELIKYISEVFELTSLQGECNVLVEKLNRCSAANLEAAMYARNCQNSTALQVAMKKNNLDAAASIINFRIEKLKQDDWKSGAPIDMLIHHSKTVKHHLSNLDRFLEYHHDMIQEVNNVLQNSLFFLDAYKREGNPSLDNQPLLIVIEESLEFFGVCKADSKLRDDWKIKGNSASFVKLLNLCILAPMLLFMKSVYSSELLEAAKRNDMVKVEKCLTGHPDLNKRDYNRWTALHHALNNRNVKMFELLLNLGADPTIATAHQKETLLHFVARHPEWTTTIDAPYILKMLFDRVHHNYDELTDYVNARLNDHSTALHLAVQSNNYPVVEFLLRKGAIYCAKNERDKMPIDCGKDRGQIVNLLKTVERFFAMANNGKIDELNDAMRRFDLDTLSIYGNARDDRGHTLDEVICWMGLIDEAERIRKLLGKFDSK